MTVTHSRSGDVAVIGMTSDAAVAFLCRSLASGAAFADYPALLIDLRRAGPITGTTRQEIALAVRSCLARHQWVGVVPSGGDVPRVIGQARRWQHLVHDDAGAAGTSLRVATNVLDGALRAAGSVVRQTATARARSRH